MTKVEKKNIVVTPLAIVIFTIAESNIISLAKIADNLPYIIIIDFGCPLEPICNPCLNITVNPFEAISTWRLTYFMQHILCYINFILYVE